MRKPIFRWSSTTSTIVLTVTSLLVLAPHLVSSADHGGHESLVMTQPLLNVPGSALTAIVVSYAPGGKSPTHRHSGSVFAYVLEGDIRSENSATGPAKVYHTGESFFEPEGSTHMISENASTTRPAKLLAVFVAETGAKLTTMNP